MNVPHPTAEQVEQAFPNYLEPAEIGRGGFKTVFRVQHSGTEEVIKLIGIPEDTNLSDDEEAFRAECLGRAMREIKILSDCRSPRIVKLGSLDPQMTEIGSFQYLAYSEEFLDGHDLLHCIQSDSISQPSQEECAELLLHLVYSVEELWSQNVVHRDIKPQNVMRLHDPNRRFVLLDLGIAFSVIDTALTVGAHNRLPPATFKYFAPEMANPDFRQNLDYRSDLYSAALTVFEYAARSHPLAMDGDDLFQTISRAARQPAKPLGKFRADFHSDFCTLIDQLLKKKPSLRPASFPQLKKRIEIFV